MTVQEILEAALALPPEDRARIVAHLAASIERRPSRSLESSPWSSNRDRHSQEIDIQMADQIDWSTDDDPQ